MSALKRSHTKKVPHRKGPTPKRSPIKFLPNLICTFKLSLVQFSLGIFGFNLLFLPMVLQYLNVLTFSLFILVNIKKKIKVQHYWLPALDCVVVAPHVWSAHSPSVVKRKRYISIYLLVGTQLKKKQKKKSTHIYT